MTHRCLLKAFGHPEEVMHDPVVYDRLYIIVPKPTGPPLVVVLRYPGGSTEEALDKGGRMRWRALDR
jgi:hypothetical protein